MIRIEGAPDIAGLAFRHFAGNADFPAMAAVATASFKADRVEIIRTADDLARDYATFTTCDPLQDIAIAEVNGQMAGYVRGWWWEQLDGLVAHGQIGFMAPAWRRKGIGLALQGWLETRQRAVAATQPAGKGHVFHSFVTETEKARAALLRAAGYLPARYFFTMVRPSLEAIEEFPLPAGLEVRSVTPADYRTIWEAHHDAFRGHFASSVKDESDYASWLANTVQFQPHLWQVAWDISTGEVAGQVRPYLNEHNDRFGKARGWTEFISVRAPWRRRGLARALIALALKAQRDAGMAESALGVDSENADGALRLYERCGFRVEKRNVVFRKNL